MTTEPYQFQVQQAAQRWYTEAERTAEEVRNLYGTIDYQLRSLISPDVDAVKVTMAAQAASRAKAALVCSEQALQTAMHAFKQIDPLHGSVDANSAWALQVAEAAVQALRSRDDARSAVGSA